MSAGSTAQGATMAKREMYDIDEADKLKREIVRPWIAEKHRRLEHFVDISRAARAKYSGNTTYIDLYCATGRARIEDTGEIVHGSAIIAAQAAGRVPFGQIHIGDLDPDHVDCCRTRLVANGFNNVHTYVGPADQTALAVADRLNPHGLHLALLDPYNLESLPFSVIAALGRHKRMDLLIHVSAMDLQRDAVGKREYHKLDAFAPGWRDHVDTNQRQDIVRQELLAYWRVLLGRLGYHAKDHMEWVRGGRNQPLYWLAFASKHPIADKFWNAIRNISPQARLL